MCFSEKDNLLQLPTPANPKTFRHNKKLPFVLVRLRHQIATLSAD